MRINDIISIFKLQIFHKKQVKTSKVKPLDIKDTVTISKKGKTLQKNKAEFLVAKKALSQIPNLRQERIRSSLLKIENNFYNKSIVKRELSRKFLTSWLFNTEISGTRIASKYKTELRRIPDVRKKKINEIREKIRNKFYNNKNTISELSSKILKDLGI